MKIRIDVTQEDIDQGEPEGPESCMVHRAIVRATEGAMPLFRVNYRQGGDACPSYVEVHDLVEGWQKVCDLPIEVDRRIRRWDAGQPARPFSFDLDLSPLVERPTT